MQQQNNLVAEGHHNKRTCIRKVEKHCFRKKCGPRMRIWFLTPVELVMAWNVRGGAGMLEKYQCFKELLRQTAAQVVESKSLPLSMDSL